MKTIADLNSKWWYRLIKVVYILALLFFLIAPVVGIVFSYAPEFDGINSYARCKDGRTVNLIKNDVHLYSEYVWSSDDKIIKDRCANSFTLEEVKNGISDDQVINRMLANSNTEYNVEAALEAGATKKQIGDYLKTQIEKNTEYTLVSAYTPRNWIATIGFSLLSVVITLLVFEVAKRIFYYILLGSIRPHKK